MPLATSASATQSSGATQALRIGLGVVSISSRSAIASSMPASPEIIFNVAGDVTRVNDSALAKPLRDDCDKI